MTYTDDNPSYAATCKWHKVVNHSKKEYINGIAHTKGIKSVWTTYKGLTQ